MTFKSGMVHSSYSRNSKEAIVLKSWRESRRVKRPWENWVMVVVICGFVLFVLNLFFNWYYGGN